jgi:hypothetical protein
MVGKPGMDLLTVAMLTALLCLSVLQLNVKRF